MRPVVIEIKPITTTIAATSTGLLGEDVPLTGLAKKVDGFGQRIALESTTATTNATTFTVTGRPIGERRTISETFTGPVGSTTVTSAKLYGEILSINSTGGAFTALTALWEATKAQTRPVVVNDRQSPFNMSLSAQVITLGSATYSLEHTVDNPEDDYDFSFGVDAFWLSSDNESSLTTSLETNLNFPVRAVRIDVPTATASTDIKFTVLQGQNG